MEYEFIADLDEFFCEKYSNYDKICALPGYRMPKMQDTKQLADGSTYAYTLPAKTMRLSLQEHKKDILAELKKGLTDASFSFSFTPIGTFQRIKNAFSKYAFYKNFRALLGRYGADWEETGKELNVSEEIWEKIGKGAFLPTKNLIFSVALVCHFSFEDTRSLLKQMEHTFDSKKVKDVVIAYLLQNKVFNRPMIDAALAEYKVENLFLK